MSTIDLLPPVPASVLSDTDIPTLVNLLRDRFAVRADHVIPTNNIRMAPDGNFEIAGLDPVEVPSRITEDGVFGGFRYDPSGLYKPNKIVDDHVSALFDIPLRYVRKMREQDTELLAINVNRWASKAPADSKRMFRTIIGQLPDQPGITGIIRAILSNRYLIMDNLDTVMSMLQGLAEAGYSAENIRAINLTESRLYIDVEVPEIAVPARSLIEGYVSPFTGQTAEELPLVHAGLRITNSEIGLGKLTLTPYAIFEICGNGAQINADRLSKVHLGGALEEGTISWSTDTKAKADDFIRAQVRDAVTHFMSTDYLNTVVDRLEENAGVEVKKPETVVETVAKEMSYTAEEQDNILSKFMVSRQFTSGGVYNAITAAAQNITDFDRRYEVEGSAFDAMKVAARAANVSA